MIDEPAHPSSDNPARFDPDRPNPATFDPDTIAQLACPACYGKLRLEGARLRCLECSLAYPVVDGIPVMIVERAERIAEES